MNYSITFLYGSIEKIVVIENVKNEAEAKKKLNEAYRVEYILNIEEIN